MASAVAKYAAKKMLSKEMDKYKTKAKTEKDVGPYDPYYQTIEHPTKPGKKKQVKKQIPAYIPEHDANILARARKSAYRLDYCLFNFAGIRWGWSSVIGLAPGIGDAAGMALAFKLILSMKKVECGLPTGVLLMMIINMAVDFLVGLIPFVGDLADAAIKCNGKNVRLLEEHLDKVYKPKRLTLAERDMRHRPAPASVYVDFSEEEDERRGTFDDRHDEVRHPQPAYSGRRERVPDEEMGLPHRSQRDERPRHDNTKKSRR